MYRDELEYKERMNGEKHEYREFEKRCVDNGVGLPTLVGTDFGRDLDMELRATGGRAYSCYNSGVWSEAVAAAGAGLRRNRM